MYSLNANNLFFVVKINLMLFYFEQSLVLGYIIYSEAVYQHRWMNKGGSVIILSFNSTRTEPKNGNIPKTFER